MNPARSFSNCPRSGDDVTWAPCAHPCVVNSRAKHLGEPTLQRLAEPPATRQGSWLQVKTFPDGCPNPATLSWVAVYPHAPYDAARSRQPLAAARFSPTC